MTTTALRASSGVECDFAIRARRAGACERHRWAFPGYTMLVVSILVGIGAYLVVKSVIQLAH